MTRRLEGKVVIATHNSGKLAEFRLFFAGRPLEVVSAGELGLPVPDETGTMFAENAAIKAHAAATATGLPAISDDSGLCVDALYGAPGLFTADWSEQPGTDAPRDWMKAMTRVRDELDKRGATAPGQRRARFVSAIVVVWPDGTELLAEGSVDGTIVWPPRGTHGHGYDPVFVPDGHDRTFAEMTEAEKIGPQDAPLSHRARALARLEAALRVSSAAFAKRLASSGTARVHGFPFLALRAPRE